MSIHHLKASCIIMILSLNFGKYDLGNDLLQLTDPILGWHRDRHKYIQNWNKILWNNSYLNHIRDCFLLHCKCWEDPTKIISVNNGIWAIVYKTLTLRNGIEWCYPHFSIWSTKIMQFTLTEVWITGWRLIKELQ